LYSREYCLIEEGIEGYGVGSKLGKLFAYLWSGVGFGLESIVCPKVG
jgi:hypothetical protein